MNKEKKIVPKLRFPEFVNEGEWNEKKLDEVCERITQGGTPDTTNTDYWNGSIEWITPAEMGKIENKYISSTARKITEAGLKNCSSDLLPINSVILSTRAPIGHLVINKTKMAMNQGCKALIPNNHTSFEYIYYCLLFYKNSLSDLGAGNTFKELSASSLKNFEIFIPKKSEQQKIASCLSSLDELIAAHTDKLEALKDHKKGLMQQLFPAEGETVPKLRFPEFEGDGEWSLKELGKIAENLDSKRIPITGTQREKGNIPYYGASGVIDYVKDYIFDDELLCISEDGANLIDRTYPIAFTINGKTWVNNHAHVLKFEKKCTQVLVENYLNAINLEDYLTGAAQPKLNQAKLSIITIPLPKPNEQQKIANFLSSIDDEITAQTQKIEALKEHKKGLMQGLFPSLN